MSRVLAGLLVATLAFSAVLADESPALAPGATPFLWEVQGAKSKHYVLGSMHMLPESVHPLPPALESAYAATRGLVFETDLEQLSSPELQSRMLGAARDDRPGGLKARVGDKLYRKLQSRAQSMGVPAPLCDTFRAWFCALTLELFAMQHAGFSPEFGVDQYFYAKAREDGRPVQGLETALQQAALFIEMSEPMSAKLLAATLEEKTSTSQSPEELLRIWRDNDTAALEKMLKELRTQYPEIYARFLANRNRAWAPKLAELFAGEIPQLVIVGAAHVPGADGLLALLKDKGITTRPVSAVIEPEAAPSTIKP